MRILRDVIRLSHDGVPLPEHARPEGTGQRRRDPAPYVAALDGRPRARLVLEREWLGALGPDVTAYVTVISQRRRRVLAEEPAACKTLDDFDFRLRPELNRPVFLRYLDEPFIAKRR